MDRRSRTARAVAGAAAGGRLRHRRGRILTRSPAVRSRSARSARSAVGGRPQPGRWIDLCVLAVVLAGATAGLQFGTSLPPAALPGAIADGLRGSNELADVIVAEANLPRVLIGLLGGAAFAVAGLLLQEGLANQLASPELLGVAPGAALAVALPQTLQAAVPALVLPVLGVCGGLLGGLLVVLLAAAVPRSIGVLLVGAAVSAAATALLVATLSAAEGFQARALFRFLSGSLTDITWHQAGPASLLLLCGLVLGAFSAPALGVLRLGEQAASALGVGHRAARVRVLLLAVALTSVVVAICGPIAWVGLFAPAVARSLRPAAGPGSWCLTTALLGAAMTLTADLLARWAFDPLESPLGAWTAVVAGVPALIATVHRGRAG